MKLDPILEKQLQWRFNKEKRKLLFVTRTKMYIQLDGADWQENCSGLFVFCQKETGHSFTIINILTFQINFDFQLFSNFSNYCKFIGDQKCLIILAPIPSKTLRIMFVMQSKQELSDLKKILDKIYNTVENINQNYDFLSRPDVIQLLKKAQIDEVILAQDVLFRKQAQQEIKTYFSQLENKRQKNIKKVGFKSYAIGREQWKIDVEETAFMKQKLFQQLEQNLLHLQKQAKIRTKK